MKSLLYLVLILFSSIFCFSQDHISDSIAFLRIGQIDFELKKRYLLYDPNMAKGQDTFFYNPPKLHAYLFDCKYQNIKTNKHYGLTYTEDPISGELGVSESETYSTYVCQHFGTIKKDSLYKLLIKKKYVIESNKKHAINCNYRITVSRKKFYRDLIGCELTFENKLFFEVMSTNKGDIVIMEDINFNDLGKTNHILSVGYWTIE